MTIEVTQEELNLLEAAFEVLVEGGGQYLMLRSKTIIQAHRGLLVKFRAARKVNSEGAWVCNQCDSAEFTGAVSADAFEDDGMSCTECGGTEFHWEKK